MFRSISAELLLLRMRASTWILLGIWVAMVAFFAYILPYLTDSTETGTPERFRDPIADLLPGNLVGNILVGFPFFGGVLVLILGVMTLGSDYGWGTLKTLLTQRPGRLQVFAAKIAAVGVVLATFVVVSFATGALASVLVAAREDAPIDWPGMSLVLRGLAAAWLILAVWTALGVALAVLSRGTSLAIGIGILYGLVIEGLVSAVFDQVSLLRPLIDGLLRANAYSLVATLGASAESARDNGPGGFSGPYVGGAQAVIVLLCYLAGFVGLAAIVLRRRDVS